MTYTKPQIVAQNQPTGSYSAGCPSITKSGNPCKTCENRS